MADHDCIDHLRHREHDWTETHGLDCGPYEHCHQEWEECAVCGERYDESDPPPERKSEAQIDAQVLGAPEYGGAIYTEKPEEKSA